MNEYLKQYIELQKQFRETEGDPDSVRALYTFKEKLELSEDKQAKEVLVDVYDLLDFKKDAYELLCQIGNRSDKKTLKRLGTLKDYAENWGNHYALPRPKTPGWRLTPNCKSSFHIPAGCWWSAERATTAARVITNPSPPQKMVGM